MNVTRSSRAQVLSFVEWKSPGALSEFPAPGAFEFRIRKRDGKDSIAVRVGFTICDKMHDLGGQPIWLEEYTPGGRDDDLSLSSAHPNARIGSSTPTANSDAQLRRIPAQNSKSKEAKRDLYLGLFYTTTDDIEVNHYVHSTRLIKGHGVFERLTSSGKSGPFTTPLKTLFRFILVYCGYRTHFETFQSARGRMIKLEGLVNVLEHVRNNTPLIERRRRLCSIQPADKVKSDRVDSTQQTDRTMAGDDVSAQHSSDRKRGLDENDDTQMPEKRIRQT